MSLVNQNWIGLNGEPVTGRVPPRMVVMNGVEPSPQQMGMIAHHYKLLTYMMKVSVIPYMVQERTLVDGTRVRVVSSYGVDTVMVWPAPPRAQLPLPFVAYPVYVGLDFLPVYDRAVIENGFIDPLYPPEPKFTEEPPEIPTGLGASHIEYRMSSKVNDHPTNPTSVTTVEIRMMRGDVELGSWTGTASTYWWTYLGSEVKGIRYNKYPRRFPFNSLALKEWVDIGGIPMQQTQPPDIPVGAPAEKFTLVTGEDRHFYQKPSSNGVDVYDNNGNIQYIGMSFSAEIYTALISANSYSAGAQAAYDEALQAYWERFREWERTVYQGWLDECFEIGLGTPSLGDYPIATLRKSGREKQSEAIRERLRGGVQDPHLAARFLSLPWNVRYKPKGAMPSTGTVVVDGPANAGAHDRRILFTLGGADRTTRVPPTPGENGADIGVDIAQFRVDPEHPLSRDMAAPQCLFGWTASGSYERYAAYRPFHNTELPEVRGLSAISFGKASGYDELMKKGVEATDRRDAVIASDVFVPPGTEITMVFFEYEVWDRHTGEWIWAPHPDLTSVDAIWMKSPGQYSFPLPYELPDGEHSPRAVRIDAVTRQRRNKDMSWTTPVAMKFKEWEKEIGPSGERRPTAVAIVGGLPPIADPVPFPFGQTSFPFVETVLWTGQPARFAALMGLPWDDVGSPVHLTVAALRAAKKV